MAKSEDDGVQVGFILRWTEIECARCGGSRHRGHVCPACGLKPDPREVDLALSRRAKIAEAARERLGVPFTGYLDEFAGPPPFEALAGVVTGIIVAANQVADDSVSRADAMAEQLRVIDDVRRLRAIGGGATRRRPWISTWGRFDDALEAILTLTSVVLDALDVSTQRQATTLAPQVQSSIDAAATAAESATAIGNLMERIGDSGSINEGLVVLFAELAKASDGDLLRLDEIGAARLGTAINRDVPVGIGLMAELLNAQAHAFFDEGRLWSLIKDLTSRIEGKIGYLRDDPEWDDAFEDADRRLRAAVNAFIALTGSARNSEEALRAALSLMMDLVEGPGRRLVAILLAVKGTRPLPWLLAKDAKVVLDLALSAGFGHVTLGLDIGLRNAKAHETYVLSGDNVQLPTGERLDVDDLVDRLLTAAESLVAIQFAVVPSCVVAGVDCQRFSRLAEIAPSPESAAELGESHHLV